MVKIKSWKRMHIRHPVQYDDSLPNDVRGTYVDIRIAYAVAMWVSPEYFFKIINIIREYDQNEHSQQLAQLTIEKQTIIDTKDSKIGELEGEISDLEDDVEERNHRINIKNSALQIAANFAEQLRSHNQQLRHQIDQQDIDIVRFQNDMKKALEDRALPASKPSKRCEFSIVRILKPTDDDPEGYLHYETIRGQKSHQTEKRLRDLKARYGTHNVQVIYREKTANSITFGQHFRDELGNDVDYHNLPSCAFSTFHFDDQGLVEIAAYIEQKLKRVNGTEYIQ